MIVSFHLLDRAVPTVLVDDGHGETRWALLTAISYEFRTEH